jgi:hypothetical protein
MIIFPHWKGNLRRGFSNGFFHQGASRCDLGRFLRRRRAAATSEVYIIARLVNRSESSFFTAAETGTHMLRAMLAA